jgi:C-terminal peptidase prc
MKYLRGHPYILAVGIPLAGAILHVVSNFSPFQKSDSGLRLAPLDQVERTRDQAFNIIAHHYVDSVTIDSSLPLPEIIARLDPFSYYVTNATYVASRRRFHDEPCKYGTSIHLTDGRVLFTAVEPGGAADRAGIWPGDEILAIGNQWLHGKDSLAHHQFFTSDSLDLTLFRESSQRIWHKLLYRVPLKEPSVAVISMVTSQIGYVSITGFHYGTSDSLRKAVQYLVGHGMLALIIDLRWNPGGYIDETLKALNLFVSSPAPAITETSVIPTQRVVLYLDDTPAYPNLPLAVLVNNESCSASELFAGTLQDYDRAVIIGEPTIGKSLVMRYFKLPDSSRLFLAVARYALPSGRWVQRPYHNGQLIGGGYRDYASCDNSRHTFDTNLAESECPVYKTQGGRSVTGLTGIVPDYFVSQSDFYPGWLRDAVVSAVGSYLRVNANWLMHTTLDSFARYCRMPEAMIDPVLDTIRAHDTTAAKLLSAKLAWMVPKIVKANVASGIWDTYGFFKLWDRNSATVRRAVGLLSKPAMQALAAKE